MDQHALPARTKYRQPWIKRREMALTAAEQAWPGSRRPERQIKHALR